MSWIRRTRRVKERVIDPAHRSIREEVGSSLLTLSPQGPWFYILLTLVEAGAVALLASVFHFDFALAASSLFAIEGVLFMVVAWLLSGREGDIGYTKLASVQRAQIAGVPDLATTIPEAQHDIDVAARNFPLILVLVLYGAALLVLAFLVVV